MEKRQALGKGLGALIPEGADIAATARVALDVDLDRLEPNDYQPRLQLDDTRLDALASSIRANGVIQPIVVRRVPNDRYQIIAGERRWRAAQRAGLSKVPVIVKDVTTTDRRRLLEMALVENVQREDLNAIEEAQAYQRLIDDFGLRQDEVAARVGKDRSSIANHLRLLKLPEDVRAEVAAGHLSMGHARALVALPDESDQRRLARDIVTRLLSVRETEALVKKLTASTSPAPAPPPTKDVHTRAAEEQLRLSLGTRVEIKRRTKGGTIEIAFGNEDELQRLYEVLTETRRG
ncbi:MAG: ParB/RepB/Spo0J family partition protein [Vicinamibacterales bacterium]